MRRPEDVSNYIRRLQREAQDIVKSVISLVYFMRGAISYTEMMQMSVPERHLISEFLDERFEVESKSPHPIY
jgi:hypothetical protein